MKNHTVVQLKAIAKERGIRGYYKLRKAELIHALEATKLVEQKNNIFHEPIPNDPTLILQKCRYKKQAKDKKKIYFYYGYAIDKDFSEWLLNYISPKPKVVDNVFESFKNKIKKNYKKRDSLFQNNTDQTCFEEFCNSVSNKRIQWLRPRIISA